LAKAYILYDLRSLDLILGLFKFLLNPLVLYIKVVVRYVCRKLILKYKTTKKLKKKKVTSASGVPDI